MASTIRRQYNISRAGLTLVEVIVAILLFTIGGLGLCAASAVMARQMSRTNLRMRSASIARVRDETFHASRCGTLLSGEETTSGIRSTWQVTSGLTPTLDQQLERQSMSAVRTDRFMSALSCE
jgi:Tfp pilus assembly protein PilV